MKLNEINFERTTIKWILNLFPPLLFNRISIKSISEDFKQVHVQIRYSWMNKNFNRTIFGGTISSAIDPTYQQCIGISFQEKNYLWRFGQKASR